MNRIDHSRWFIGAAWAVIASAMVLICMVTFWLVYPYPGLTSDAQRPEVRTPIVAQGEVLRYDVSYCYEGSLPVYISVFRELRKVENDQEVIIFPISSSIRYQITERCETRNIAFPIPVGQPPGTYRIYYVSDLEVNPFRTIQQSWKSSDFEIVKWRGEPIGVLPPTHVPVK
jgi:hypothetical protein